MDSDVALASRGLMAKREAISERVDRFHPITRAKSISRVSDWVTERETFSHGGIPKKYQSAKKWLLAKTGPMRAAAIAHNLRGEHSMSPTTAVEWDVNRIIEDGVVAVRDLSQHTTQVLKAVETRGRPVLVTRNGRVVASIAPITMRQVVDRIVANESDVRDSLTAAEKALRDGTTQSIHKLPTAFDADA